MTKKQTNELMRALAHLERAKAYLFRPEVAIAQKGTMASTTLHYARACDRSVLCEVEKAYGSDLTGLDAGIQGLRAFLGFKDSQEEDY